MPGFRHSRWVIAILALTLLAGCSHATEVATPPSTTTTTTTGPNPAYPNRGKPTWIINIGAVAVLRKAGLSESLIRYFFNNPQTYITTGGENIRAEFPRAIPAESFGSYAVMRITFATHSLYPGTRAILYDNEDWSRTPATESALPIQYAAKAEALVHRHGLTFIFTPATDLANINAGGAPGGVATFQRYLFRGLAEGGAKVSDVFEIQAQQAEATPEFEPFTMTAAAQARAANPHAVVLAGIGTNPVGRPVTTRELLTAYRLSRAVVDGYWFNMPQGGSACPSCETGQPYVAASFFRALARILGH